MGLFKKETMVYSPVTGYVKSIEQVEDEMFASKALGDGFAVEPLEGAIASPIIGTVTGIFPTKHAISLEAKNGLEVLLHIGIDTVELNGSGFDIKVEEGESITPDKTIAVVDFTYLKAKGKQTDVLVIFTNLGKKTLEITNGKSVFGQKTGSVK